jgi:2Fe-2S ferredoxin
MSMFLIHLLLQTHNEEIPLTRMSVNTETADTDQITVEVIDRAGVSHTIQVPDDIGLNMMEVCLASGLPITSVCSGMAICGGCHAYVLSDHPLTPISEQEEETLDKLFHVQENSRLCCQIHVDKRIDGLKIQLAPV